LRWRFHANQRVEPLDDGSVIVRFRASGMLELAWHLFTWGDKVQVVAPEALKQTLADQLEIARRTHTTGTVAADA
jgi:predicted DNA-binding transcriptional regulator YafY